MIGDRKRIVIVGGVACGPKAAARARRRDPKAEITIIERGRCLSYAGCGLPYYIGGSVSDINGLRTTQYGVLQDEAFFAAVKDITIRTGTSAESIDRTGCTLLVRDLESGRREEIPYDRLVLATGASPVPLPVSGADLKRVFSLRVPDDAVKIRELVEGGTVDRAVLIGGGRVSLEAAESLFAHAVDCTIVELEDRLLPGALDPEMSAVVASELRANDVEILTSEKVLRLEGNGNGVVCRVVTDKRTIETDMVVVAIGVRPNVDLARDAGLGIGPTGAIAVDGSLRTSDPKIYAGGDCVETTHLLSGEKVYAPLGSTANRHGRVIGDNVTGGSERFPGIVGTWVLKTMRINVAATGWSEQEARLRGRRVVTCLTPSLDHVHYYPGGKTFIAKLVADADTGQLVGAQIVGPGDVTKRIDILATALRFGSSVEDVSNLDLAYAPPFSTAVDSVAHASNILRNKLSGLAVSISPLELRRRIDQGEHVLVIDVREPGEVEKSPITDAPVVCIPHGRLRDRVSDLPRDRDLVCTCQIGARGYEASLLLHGAGLSRAMFLDGGLRVWSCLPKQE